MSVLNTCSISCPYCSGKIEVVVDISIESQEYVEDCEICCRPILLTINCEENNKIHIQARQENE